MTRLGQALRAAQAAYRQSGSFMPVAARIGIFVVLVWVSGITSLWSATADAGELSGAVPPVNARPDGPMSVQQDIQPTPTATFDRGSDPITPTPAPTPVPPPAPPPPAPAPVAPAAPAPPVASPSPPAIPPTATPIGDPCWGDEQITYIPEVPRAGNELILAVTSSRPHPYGRVAGTERTTFVRERPGQLGYVWEWSVALTWTGRHRYTFYVDSTIPCKEIEISVRQSIATKTPTPYGMTNENSEDGDNEDGDNEDGDNN